MNNKGFAVTGILYTVLVIFLVSITIMLFNLQNRKTILDTLKADTVEAVEENNNFEYLLQRIEELEGKTATVDTIYPVGSVYITTSNVNPSELFPGTEWSSYSEGRTLVGMGNNGTDNYTTVNSTGGSSTKQLAIANLPAHTHSVTAKGTISSTFTGSSATTSSSGNHYHDELHWSGPTAGQFGVNSGSGGAIWRFYYDGVNGAAEPNFYTGYAGVHTHTVVAKGTVSSTFTGTAVTSGSTGSGTAFSTQDPYITVYMWKRTK